MCGGRRRFLPSFRAGPYARTVPEVTWGAKGPKGGGIVGINALRPRWQHHGSRPNSVRYWQTKTPWSVAAERAANTGSAILMLVL
jgi:hypothetical protein